MPFASPHSLPPCRRGAAAGGGEGHVHGAVQVDGGGQGGAGLLTTAGLAVQPAQPVVAVGHERAHAEFLGQGQGLLVVGFGLRDIGGIGVGMDGAKLVQRERLVPASFCCRARSSAWRACCQASSPRPARRQTSLSHATRWA